MNRTLKLQASLAGAAGAVVLLAACGSSGGSDNAVVNQPQSSNGTSAAAVTVHTTSLGKVLADSSGKTIYVLTANGKDVKCTGACQSIWEPVQASGTPQAASGVSAMIATSGSQVTVAGHPVYTYTADSGPGQATGQGVQSFGGTWWVLDSAGNLMTASMGAPAPTGSSGYGY
jgi:predicted lipoprotein with Yx(FWY)xxD motif